MRVERTFFKVFQHLVHTVTDAHERINFSLNIFLPSNVHLCLPKSVFPSALHGGPKILSTPL